MPAGRGKAVLDVLLDEFGSEARVQMDCAAFSSSPLAERFQAFGTWLIQKVGGHKAALEPSTSTWTFFLEIEREWQDIPTYEKLLSHFSAGGLRRYLLPMRWIEESGIVAADAALREADSDRRRIRASLDKFHEASHARAILNGYYEHLLQKVEAGTTTLRSVRLAISPAVSLLTFADVMDCMPPSQKALDGFLRQSPGQRAALSGFVNYLREKHGIEIILPKHDLQRGRRERHKNLGAEMLTLMREGGNDREKKQRWLCVALAYFHDLPLKTGQNIKQKDITTDVSGMTVRTGGGNYWIPHLNTG